MILTFREMAINIADYNGMTWALARAEIINATCDFIMHTIVKDTSVDELDVIPNPEEADVNLTMGTVTIVVNMDSVTLH
jgi:hypothetical protein